MEDEVVVDTDRRRVEEHSIEVSNDDELSMIEMTTDSTGFVVEKVQRYVHRD